MIDHSLFWLAIKATLFLSLILQIGFFIVAAIKKTDALTDLSYGLTFVVLVWWLAMRLAPVGPLAVALVGMVTLWGLRLAGYLFIRVILMKRDKRFDGIRENPLKFGAFWLLQAISIWVILLPTLHGISITQFAKFLPIHWVGLGLWGIGLVIEAVADWQKFVFKTNPANQGKWIETGIWKHSRHPNYFGELLCWWSIFLMVTPQLSGWAWVVVAGPLQISILILWISGIPTLEKHYAKIYAKNHLFHDYQRRTSLLVPWFVSK